MGCRAIDECLNECEYGYINERKLRTYVLAAPCKRSIPQVITRVSLVLGSEVGLCVVNV
jgi:hypothetical protein